MKGNDHVCSLAPIEFAEMVKSIRAMELGLGTPMKKFQECEEACFQKLGKSVVASKRLKRGAVLTEDDFCIKVNFPRVLDMSCWYRRVTFYDSVAGKISQLENSRTGQ